MTSTNIASDGSKRTKVGMSLNKGEAGSSPEILPIFLFEAAQSLKQEPKTVS